MRDSLPSRRLSLLSIARLALLLAVFVALALADYVPPLIAWSLATKHSCDMFRQVIFVQAGIASGTQPAAMIMISFAAFLLQKQVSALGVGLLRTGAQLQQPGAHQPSSC